MTGGHYGRYYGYPLQLCVATIRRSAVSRDAMPPAFNKRGARESKPWQSR